MRIFRENITCDGTYTVEAALVFPIVFFIILFLLNYTFYSYDKAKLQSELNDIVRKANGYMSYEIGLMDNELDRLSIMKKDTLWVLLGNRQPKEYVLQEYINNRLSSGYYVMDIENIGVSSTFTRVKVEGTVNIKFYGFHFINQFFSEPLVFTYNQTTNTFPREEKARVLEAAISLGRGIKGVDEVIAQLATFIGYIH